MQHIVLELLCVELVVLSCMFEMWMDTDESAMNVEKHGVVCADLVSVDYMEYALFTVGWEQRNRRSGF